MNMASVLRPTPMTICFVLESRTARPVLFRVSSRPGNGFFKRKRMKNSVERIMKATTAANWKTMPPMRSVSMICEGREKEMTPTKSDVPPLLGACSGVSC